MVASFTSSSPNAVESGAGTVLLVPPTTGYTVWQPILLTDRVRLRLHMVVYADNPFIVNWMVSCDQPPVLRGTTWGPVPPQVLSGPILNPVGFTDTLFVPAHGAQLDELVPYYGRVDVWNPSTTLYLSFRWQHRLHD
jgi:hypothetical protein